MSESPENENKDELIGTIYFDTCECCYVLELPGGTKLATPTLCGLGDMLDVADQVRCGSLSILPAKKNKN